MYRWTRQERLPVSGAVAHADCDVTGQGSPTRVNPNTWCGLLIELCSKDPANELGRALLMKALAGCGRQAAALKEFGDIWTYLDQELGVLPGRALNEAHLAVLHQSIPPPRLRQSEVTQGTAAAERSRS